MNELLTCFCSVMSCFVLQLLCLSATFSAAKFLVEEVILGTTLLEKPAYTSTKTQHNAGLAASLCWRFFLFTEREVVLRCC